MARGSLVTLHQSKSQFQLEELQRGILSKNSKIKLLLIVSAWGPENPKYSDENLITIITIVCDWC
jgi:uncharacterized protein YdgA (DUF945 family)